MLKPRRKTKHSTQQQLSLDGSFEYVVKRQRRKTIALHVLENAQVEVRAPSWVPKYELVQFVEQRAEWVISQRQKALEKLSQKPSYRPGQQHYFMGETFPLHLEVAKRSNVALRDDMLLIKVPEISNEKRIETALTHWYRKQAVDIFEERFFFCYERFPNWFQDKYSMPNMRIRKMRSRWGSCSSRGEITLNLQLIKMPLSCVDYVIYHELCHLEFFHHGTSFYQLLTCVCPDWQQIEKRIEAFANM